MRLYRVKYGIKEENRTRSDWFTSKREAMKAMRKITYQYEENGTQFYGVEAVPITTTRAGLVELLNKLTK